uniref:uncharacterized protein LOC120341315 n=1 Tax=Styela clava TaxID=7725 RepID=UPI00193970B2|nr:uncharacterized protein LOC120341315 [Styela clava]
MANYLNNDWLDACIKELDFPGSPWYEVKECISKYLIERIRQEGLTDDEFAKFRYFLGTDFTSTHKLKRTEAAVNKTIKRPNIRDEKLEHLLKDLTVKAAGDAKCTLKNDISSSPECFQDMVSLVRKIFESSLESKLQVARMSQLTQFGSNTSVIALNTLVSKDIEILGEAVMKILQKEPSRLTNISQRLLGRLLPVTLRRLIYRLVLIKTQKLSGYPGSNVGIGVLAQDNEITQQGLREAFAKGMKVGMRELGSKDPTKSPLQHLIQMAVIEVYETISGLRPHSKNMEIQRECANVLNILYTFSRKFQRSYILWVFPLQITISQDRYTKEHQYELAMWLNCIVKSCFPSNINSVNALVLNIWKKIVDGNLDSSHLGISFIKHLMKIGIKYKTYRSLCLRKWIMDLFVGVTDLPVLMFIWDQLFLNNWESTALETACLSLLHVIQVDLVRTLNVDTLCTDMLEKPVMVKLYEVQSDIIWKCIKKSNAFSKVSQSWNISWHSLSLSMFLKAKVNDKRIRDEALTLDEQFNNALSLISLKDAETFLLVLIMTAPKSRDRRDAIRETWLKYSIQQHSKKSLAGQQDISHYFVLGTAGLEQDQIEAIKEEQTQHNDLILLEGFVDAYEKLTEKLALMLMNVRDQINFKYVFKADDDTFARIDILYEELKKRHIKFPTEKLYYGYFYGKGRVKKKGPWKETDWKLCDTYIPYARGGGYIISSNIVDYVANNFHLFQRYVSEDVSLGAWLAPLAVQRVHDKRFDTEYKTRGCSNAYIVSHKQSILDMKTKQKFLESHGKLCEKEFSNFPGYEYNWDVPPSQCCERTKDIP